MSARMAATAGTSAVIENLNINGAPAQPFFNSTGCENDYVGVYFHGASGKLSALHAT